MEPLPIALVTLAIALIIGNVAIHSVGTFFLLWGFVKFTATNSGWPASMRITVGVTIRVLASLLLHMLEVALWAALYYKEGCFSDPRTSLYFSLTVAQKSAVLTRQIVKSTVAVRRW
jgi:hypothetical protein